MSTVPPDAKPQLAAMARLKHDAVRAVDMLLLPERVVKLNASGAAILSLCDGTRTLAEIARELEERFGEGDLQADVMEFIESVVAQRWVTL